MVDAVPHTAKLDEYLWDMIQAVYGASSTGNAHLKDDPKAVERSLEDCKEVLDSIMEGHVDEWIA